MKDLVIIGAGPAGLTSAIYGIRAGLDLIILEKLSPGGQAVNTYEIENYPGFIEPIAGWELMSAMENQAKRLGAEFRSVQVDKIEKDPEKGIFALKLSDGSQIMSKTVIAATGASIKKMNIPGEAELTGRGVSYCATCDGAFYKDKTVAVLGGGNAALEEAIFLTRFASKVYLIHRRDKFRGAKVLQERVLANKNIVPVYDTVLTSVNGDPSVESISIKNSASQKTEDIKVQGIFIYIGQKPNTGYLSEDVLNERGEVIVDMHMKTKVEGLFAAGDLRQDSIRQIITAASDGAIAAVSAYEYISRIEGSEYGEYKK